MPAKGTRPKWKNTYYLKLFELSRSGLTDTEIAQALGVSKATLKFWKSSDPAVKDAVQRGRSTLNPEGQGMSFLDYVYGRLPKKIRRLWNKLAAAEECKNPEKRIELLLADKGRRTRQWLFVHAVVVANFSLTEALRMSYVSLKTFENWQKDDPDFLEMIGFLHKMKKEWAEGALMSLVAQGDTTATIFLNRALNPERGYNPKIQVVNTGKVLHGHVSVEKLLAGLSIEAQREMLKQYDDQSEGKTPKALPPRKVTVTDEE